MEAASKGKWLVTKLRIRRMRKLAVNQELILPQEEEESRRGIPRYRPIYFQRSCLRIVSTSFFVETFNGLKERRSNKCFGNIRNKNQKK
jgi:hypothetical protein